MRTKVEIKEGELGMEKEFLKNDKSWERIFGGKEITVALAD